jgi:hypothetical protein
MPIEKLFYHPYDGISERETCDKINEIIDLLNKILSPIEFKPTGKFFVECPDNDKAVRGCMPIEKLDTKCIMFERGNFHSENHANILGSLSDKINELIETVNELKYVARRQIVSYDAIAERNK